MTLRGLRDRDDRGATIILLAISAVALFTIVAIVIDLGAVRSQRRQGQSAADSAAAAAGAALAESDSVVACQDALEYLTINLDIPAFTGLDCNSTFSGTCVDAVERTATGTSDEFTVTLVHPVSNASPLMGGTGIGSPAQAATPDDGSPCDRFGVQLDIDGNTFFGGVVGIADYDTAVHSVARVNSGNTETRPLNLLLLDRTGCQTLQNTGQGKVRVRAPFDPDIGEFVKGIAATDSNGSECGGQNAIIEAKGNNSFIQADGPCPANPTTECEYEGTIEVFGDTWLTTGRCDGNTEVHSCKGFDDSSIEPTVRASLGQFTRAPIDYRYNCKPSYVSEPWYPSQAIPGCTDPTSGAYIDTLKSYASGVNDATPGWTRLNGPACTVGSGSNVTYPPGNYFVDCNDFRVQGMVEFQGGNLVFKRDITLTSTSSSLRTNTCRPAAPLCGTVTWSPGNPFTAVTAAQSSENASWAYVRGEISKSAEAIVEFDHMLVLLAESSKGTSLTGGSGQLTWIAPSEGAFDDLALWAETPWSPTGPTSNNGFAFGGQTVLTLEGVFFVPRAPVKYAGTGTQQQADAQFVAFRLDVSGQGSLGIVPPPGRAVEFPIDPTSGLIR